MGEENIAIDCELYSDDILSILSGLIDAWPVDSYMTTNTHTVDDQTGNEMQNSHVTDS
ncbi:hypothetical protein Pmar_PMAR018146 [Perkinsus marinus ATCC 50983]|uniref:Uncharacterized protein n=1 Tax=Perkinsus marinus (strain ATCC 50983 / TXsc) TaxID=423536 RepID=C5KF24_PERM5|nr:hypothetical protein Pmar_PMAR007102 [Perkinsus marinus ATCC 50983]XP_002785123.1 hypothetical protein Pmar_PMAR018146 [Perkinsus marinus ATCC 50983]EER07072.1 hypothetical protein Pmar_PMAR007102 [Perkinsus marinus ATCC 50983]EER16919.1 hypothetical protein Pmar_PMAR018146 [Perkinsus marinus ATCC 50983]|eukprot:XP_002775256.1 hypothetical protein Pmar_PMAR007102 [Perkinsus marinus ATCC 50983]